MWDGKRIGLLGICLFIILISCLSTSALGEVSTLAKKPTLGTATLSINAALDVTQVEGTVSLIRGGKSVDQSFQINIPWYWKTVTVKLTGDVGTQVKLSGKAWRTSFKKAPYTSLPSGPWTLKNGGTIKINTN
ncbi:MAG TPA: hypothetical protein VN372_04635 [Methanospirillum sp.]|nr:hypothetical protein [Methanospirillum sp.]